MTIVHINLPDDLAQRAASAGLLSTEAMEAMLREQLRHRAGSATMTECIADEAQAAPAEALTTDDPAFGIWCDREDMTDVAAHVRKVRQPRYDRDGSRNES